MSRAVSRAAARTVAALAVAVGLASTSGCTMQPGGEAVACPSWVHFETPADAVADSDAVFIGTVVGPDGTAPSMEVDMAAWTVEVAQVLAGDDASAGETVRVVSTADPCSGEAVYDAGDPLDAVGEQLLIFAYSQDGALWTLTPYQGVLPAPADGTLPEAWPAD